jgi:hypothetical protein
VALCCHGNRHSDRHRYAVAKTPRGLGIPPAGGARQWTDGLPGQSRQAPWPRRRDGLSAGEGTAACWFLTYEVTREHAVSDRGTTAFTLARRSSSSRKRKAVRCEVDDLPMRRPTDQLKFGLRPAISRNFLRATSLCSEAAPAAYSCRGRRTCHARAPTLC